MGVFIGLVVSSPFWVACWRILLFGDPASQAMIVLLGVLVWLIVDVVRRWRGMRVESSTPPQERKTGRSKRGRRQR